ncbi:MAG: hypothetical protein AAF583_08340 [Pseudomonadota bacterium]
MNISQAIQLKDLARARYQSELAISKKLADEEWGLRCRLNEVFEDQKRLQSDLEKEIVPFRSIGGDVLWQASLSRCRNQLEYDLTRLKSRKSDAMARLGIAFGRYDAASEALESALVEAERIKLAKVASDMMSASLLSKFLD